MHTITRSSEEFSLAETKNLSGLISFHIPFAFPTVLSYEDIKFYHVFLPFIDIKTKIDLQIKYQSENLLYHDKKLCHLHLCVLYFSNLEFRFFIKIQPSNFLKN